MKLIWFFVAILYTAFAGGPDQTDPTLEDADTVAILKASYLFKFATSNEWPSTTEKGTFKIAVFGNNNIYRELLSKHATKAIGDQTLEIKELTSPATSDFYHMIYVSDSQPEALSAIVKSVGNKPTMIIAENRDNLKKGAMICFVTVENSTRYVINSEAAIKRNITLGSTIILWAVSN
jgi:hypothetical protein